MTPVTFQKHLEQQDTRAAGSPPGVLMPRAMAKNAGIDSEEARLQAKSLPQKTAGRNDRHDIDPRELKLLRVGHYLWAIYKKECGKSGNVSQQGYGDPRLDQLIRAREHTRRMREQGELRRPARRMDKGLEERMKRGRSGVLGRAGAWRDRARDRQGCSRLATQNAFAPATIRAIAFNSCAAAGMAPDGLGDHAASPGTAPVAGKAGG
jgi:hypothetical protein